MGRGRMHEFKLRLVKALLAPPESVFDQEVGNDCSSAASMPPRRCKVWLHYSSVTPDKRMMGINEALRCYQYHFNCKFLHHGTNIGNCSCYLILRLLGLVLVSSFFFFFLGDTPPCATFSLTHQWLDDSIIYLLQGDRSHLDWTGCTWRITLSDFSGGFSSIQTLILGEKQQSVWHGGRC